MKPRVNPWAIPLMVLLAASLAPALAGAQSAGLIGVKGTSTGAGVAGVTIESFGSLGNRAVPDPNRVLAPTYNANVPIPAATPPQVTAARIRDSLAVKLPGDYSLRLVGHSTVEVKRSSGTFTIAASSSAPGQTVGPVPLPGLSGTGLALLSLLLAATGAWFVVKRRPLARVGPISRR